MYKAPLTELYLCFLMVFKHQFIVFGIEVGGAVAKIVMNWIPAIHFI